jgi:protein-tyrosine-phosphatase
LADGPTVVFVCVENAGRSQIAEALFNAAASGRARARSAGSRPATGVHPAVVQALQEVGIDVSRNTPKGLDDVRLDDADVVVTMGCGDECPVVPGARRLDWDLPDPAGRPIAQVRAIRDDIAARVTGLLAELT